MTQHLPKSRYLLQLAARLDSWSERRDSGGDRWRAEQQVERPEAAVGADSAVADAATDDATCLVVSQIN